MQFLIEFAQEDSDFLQILRRATAYPIVQGVVLDLDRFWLLAWQVRQRMGDQSVSRLVEVWDVGGLRFGGPPEWLRELYRTPQIYARPIERFDIDNWRPPHWDYYQRTLGVPEDAPPLVVRVCLRPRANSEEIPTVEALAAGKRLRVEIQPRSQARLSSNPRRRHRPIPGGVSIGALPTDFGTMGVILTDSQGNRFGLTCSHVAAQYATVDQPAQRDGSGGSMVGKSILATTLSTCTSTTPCNPWSGISANEVDLSLIDIDPASTPSILEVLDIGPLSGAVPRASLSTGQMVEVMGRTTRYSLLQIGGLATWYRFQRGASYFCFKNLFEVESPYGSTGAIRSGDSGAPVCTATSSGTGWSGIIVGCDTSKGYAIYSETAETWLRNNGYKLQVT
jgi:hypothetical protein